MRVLYYFCDYQNPMYQWQREHFFDELSHYNIEFCVFNPLLFENPDIANEKLIETVKLKEYDLFFTDLCYHKILYVDTIEEIKRCGVPTLSLRCDNLTIPYLDKVLGPHFDLLWLCSKETKYLYDRWGVTTMFAPFAANPYKYVYNQRDLIRRSCFIGTPYGSRTHLLNTLSSNQIPVDLFFGGRKNSNKDNVIHECYDLPEMSRYQNLLVRLKYKEGRKLLRGALVDRFSKSQQLLLNEYVNIQPSLPFKAMIQNYSDYVLDISYSSTEHTDVLKNPLCRTFLRTFEIPMCGGLQICKYFDEIAEYFEDGKEIILYKNEEELIDKAKYYIEKASSSKILKMKESARIRSLSEHTWINRFSTAFDKLGLKYK